MTLDEKEYKKIIKRINRKRHRKAMQGEPGDPPTFICMFCGFEDCECRVVSESKEENE